LRSRLVHFKKIIFKTEKTSFNQFKNSKFKKIFKGLLKCFTYFFSILSTSIKKCRLEKGKHKAPNHKLLELFGLVAKSSTHTGLICVKIPATNISCMGPFKKKFLKSVNSYSTLYYTMIIYFSQNKVCIALINEILAFRTYLINNTKDISPLLSTCKHLFTLITISFIKTIVNKHQILQIKEYSC
jgi:hypothetical protein